MSAPRPPQEPGQQALGEPPEDGSQAAAGDDATMSQEGSIEAAPVRRLYSAELVLGEAGYLLIVRNHVHGTVQSTRVANKAVAKLPTYLAKLDLRPHQ